MFDWIKSKEGGKKGVVIANTGAGKTLAVVLYIYFLLSNNPRLKVYANFHINLPRCYYTPYMLFNFETLEDAVLVFDDVSNAAFLKRYASACANVSRKSNLILIFIGQREKMITPEIRDITDFRIYPKIKKKKDLYVTMIWEDKHKKVVYKNIFDWLDCRKFNGKQIYDTKEKVIQILEDDAIKEIIKISKTQRDIKRNIFLISGDKRERKSLFIEIMKKINKAKNGPGSEKSISNKQILEGLIKYHFMEGKSEEETAKIIGIPRSTLQYHKRKIKNTTDKSI